MGMDTGALCCLCRLQLCVNITPVGLLIVIFLGLCFLNSSCMWEKNFSQIFWSSKGNMHKAVKAFSLSSDVCASAVEWHCLGSVFKEGKE